MKMHRLVVAALLATAGISFAQTTTVQSGTFNVTVSLTPLCSVKTNGSALDFGAYSPFATGTGAATPSPTTTVAFQCSQGITPTSIGFVNTVGTAGQFTTSTAGTGAQTAEGVIKGLRYTLSIPTMAAALTAGGSGTVAAAGAGGTGGTNSSAKVYSFLVTGNMPAGQSGGTGGDSSHTWRLDLVY